VTPEWKNPDWRRWGGRGLTDEVIRGGTRRAGRSGGEGPEGPRGALAWGGMPVSWKGRRGALARGGARGGDSRAEGWSEEAALSGQGCDGRHWHSPRRKKGCSTGGGGGCSF
jgi:hypothetical protein